ncbi:hypothetical protein Acr_07g0011800 [Actinidia rufa]|uniref:Uncharacterized protein n=1 Tax=Actinidia rufa TaxID=165716 RepID=A0A7J0EWY3_9ERIC|nr:hypothetical protein Acr_07g0011800 [Actinidia rufa]
MLDEIGVYLRHLVECPCENLDICFRSVQALHDHSLQVSLNVFQNFVIFLNQLHFFHGRLSGDRSEPISANNCIIRGRYITNNKLCNQLLGTSLDFEGYSPQGPVKLSDELIKKKLQSSIILDFLPLLLVKGTFQPLIVPFGIPTHGVHLSSVNFFGWSIPSMSRKNGVWYLRTGSLGSGLVVQATDLVGMMTFIECLTEFNAGMSSAWKHPPLARCHGFTIAPTIQADMGSMLPPILTFPGRKALDGYVPAGSSLRDQPTWFLPRGGLGHPLGIY